MEKYLGYIISFLWSPILFLLIGLLYIYRCCIEWILSIKYGHKFGGILNGKDARLAKAFPSEHIINMLFFVDFKTSDQEKVCEILRAALKPVFECEHFQKVTCTLHQEYGYHFLKRNQYSYNEAVLTFSVNHSNDMEEIQKYLSKISNKKMLGRPNSLMEFLVSREPLIKNNQVIFPLIIRYHHVLADGPAIIHFTSLIFQSDVFKHVTVICKEKKSKDTLQKIKNFTSAFFYLTFGTYSVLRAGDLRPQEKNLFHNRYLSGEQIVQWLNEDEENLVGKIKAIRIRTGATFTQILQTAIVASLQQFASNKCQELKWLTIAKTVSIRKIDASQLPKLENNIAVSVTKFSLSNNLKTLLSNVVEIDRVSNQTILLQTITSIVQVIGLVAPTMFDSLYRSRNVTLILTNMGQLNKTTFLGYELKDFAYSVPNSDFIGLSFGVKCYAGKLSICATIDRSILDNVSDVDEILKKAFDNIEQLYEEII